MTNQGSDYQWFSFPEFDPIAIAIGPLAIRWYAIAYMAGLLGGWYILRRLARHQNSPVTTIQLDSLLNWVLFGVIIGGRLGYVLFYKPLAYLGDPLSIIRVWEGGMSFHGGFLGVVLAVYLFARRHKVPLAIRWDSPCCAIRIVIWPPRQFYQWRALWPYRPIPLASYFQMEAPCPVTHHNYMKQD